VRHGGEGVEYLFPCPQQCLPSVLYDETYDFSYGLLYVAFGLPWELVYGFCLKMQDYWDIYPKMGYNIAMTPNNLHNLMTQMIQEQKSLWRIENNYINESGSDIEKEFWTKLGNEKKMYIEELKKLIKENI
jgi:hypothetical protein